MNGITNKGALLRWSALLLLLPATAQTPATPQIFAEWTSDAGPVRQAVVIDPPLSFTLDATGQAHLSVTLLAGVGITCASQGQCFVDTAVIQSKLNALSGTAPQNCVSTSGATVNYKASCAFALSRLEKFQVFNWFVDVANTGPVSLAVDTLPSMIVCDRLGNQIATPNKLKKGLWHVWNDGTKWKISEFI